MNIKELTRDRILLFDGAMGTMLQQRGLMPGELPEFLNLSHPDIVTDIHREYVLAGADVITANTFQAHELKLGSPARVDEVVAAGIRCVKAAGARFAALDVGPLGQLMEPMGTVTFERAYEVYKGQVLAGAKAGADLIIIETISDPYEAKAAILAAKENTDLPVICSLTFQEDGRTFVGCDALTAALLLQGLGADAIGVNCSRGPESLAPVVDVFLCYSHVPVILQANAGMPCLRDGCAVYELSPVEYVKQVMAQIRRGVKIAGGCCGTTPEHIRLLKEQTNGFSPVLTKPRRITACTSGTRTVIFDGATTEIGERLNPTGKKKMQQALRAGDSAYIINEALAQTQAGAAVLDVNAGVPDIDESAALVAAIRAVQSVTDAPVQIDSSDSVAIEAGLRIYNGKAIINSVNGKAESMSRIFPLAKKYGAMVVGLTLDDGGIPPTAAGRLEIARRIRDCAHVYGIPDEDLIIDCLVLTASAQQEQVRETLGAIRLVKSELGLKTVLGVSNVSFGLPDREGLNAVFLASALGAGLDAAILNPLSPRYRETLEAYRVLSGEDKDAAVYIARKSEKNPATATETVAAELSLGEIIEQGRRDQAAEAARKLLDRKLPLEIIDNELIPALNRVGKGFENGTVFLPQLLMSAQTAQNAFDEISGHMLSGDVETRREKGKILLATVQGDIHDIGKNIARALLETYGYNVLDLGKDVAPEVIVNTAREKGIRLVGLSALMTTTVKSMKDTIALARREGLDCSFFVGGAVLSPEYAEFAGADFYAKDAMEGVAIADRFFSGV